MNHEQAMRRAEEMELPEPLHRCEGNAHATHYTEAQVREAIAAALVKYTQGQEPDATGCRCSICNEWQRYTPSGMVCKNGHGGAPGINTPMNTHPAPSQPEHDSEWEQRWPNAETPAPSRQEERKPLTFYTGGAERVRFGWNIADNIKEKK